LILLEVNTLHKAFRGTLLGHHLKALSYRGLTLEWVMGSAENPDEQHAQSEPPGFSQGRTDWPGGPVRGRRRGAAGGGGAGSAAG
jgi:hypothetical protein